MNPKRRINSFFIAHRFSHRSSLIERGNHEITKKIRRDGGARAVAFEFVHHVAGGE